MSQRAATSLACVVAVAAPAADRLVALLAPWDRARLRLVCRALAAAVPVGSCAPTLAAMVRARGAGLLRYGAGDAHAGWTHVLVAVEADAADALRWLLRPGRCAAQDRTWELARLALGMGSVAAWRVVEPLLPRQGLGGASTLLADACLGGCGVLVAERAAAAAYCDDSHDDAHLALLGTIEQAWRMDTPDVLLPFLSFRHRTTLYGSFASGAALAMGRRELAEPCDWAGRLLPSSLLVAALRGGDLPLAELALRRRPPLDAAVCYAAQARRNVPAVLEWAADARGAVDPNEAARYAIRADAVDALRWLSRRAGLVPFSAHELLMACHHNAAACVAFLADEAGVRPASETLCVALRSEAYRAAEAVAVRVAPLDAAAFVRLAVALSADRCGGVRAMALLRRHALLPAPGPAFLRACADSLRRTRELRALAMAGYRVDADARTWFDSVRPHCVGTPRRVWRTLAHVLHDRWHRDRDSH